GTFAARSRREALPLEQEPQKIGSRDGFDFLPKPVERIAMDTREQPALAPFGDRDAAGEPAAQRKSFVLERRESEIDVDDRQAQRVREITRSGGSDDLAPAAPQLTDRVCSAPRFRGVALARW